MMRLILAAVTVFVTQSAMAADRPVDAVKLFQESGMKSFFCQLKLASKVKGDDIGELESHVVWASNEKEALNSCMTKIGAGIDKSAGRPAVVASKTVSSPNVWRTIQTIWISRVD